MIDLLKNISIEIFGVGSLVFIILGVWIKLLISEKNEFKKENKEKEEKIFQLLQSISNSEKYTAEIIKSFTVFIEKLDEKSSSLEENVEKLKDNFQQTAMEIKLNQSKNEQLLESILEIIKKMNDK